MQSDFPLAKSLANLSEIRQVLSERYPKHVLLYRGQNNCHGEIRSGLSRPHVELHEEVERGWSVITGIVLGDEGASHRSQPFRRALMQHYGLPTNYIDLSASIEVAAWFAKNERKVHSQVWGGEPPRLDEIVQYAGRDEGLGYIVVLAIPEDRGLKGSDRLFDLTRIDGLLRPNRQSAWLILDHQPLLPDPNDFWVDTIEIDCSTFEPPLSTKFLFPPPAEDPAYKILLGFPYVEAPWPYLHNSESIEAKALRPLKEYAKERGFPDAALRIARRAIAVPEYYDGGEPYLDHKWADETLYEPPPMRLWKNWQFELSDLHPGIAGNISQSVKLTVSPRAMDTLRRRPGRSRLAWPKLGSNDLLFTFSQIAYDKVDDLTWPFEGVWLHRKGDLIIEHQVTADIEALRVHPGLTYTLVGGRLRRESAHSECPCKKPRSHDRRTRAVLKLPSFIETEYAAIVPHPSGISEWYIVI
jgi:FRG domain